MKNIFNLNESEKNRIRGLHSINEQRPGTSRTISEQTPFFGGHRLDEKWKECQDNSPMSREDEQNFGYLFNSINPMGTDEDVVFKVMEKLTPESMENFEIRLTCMGIVSGDGYEGVLRDGGGHDSFISWVRSDLNNTENERLTNILGTVYK